MQTTMRPSTLRFSAAAVVAVFSVVAAPPSVRATVVSPYANDFSSQVDDFTENGSADWTLDTADDVYTLYKTGTAADYDLSATVEVANLGGASTADFTLSTTLSVLQTRGGFGFAVLSDSAVINSSSHYYQAEFAEISGGWQMHLSERNGDAGNAPSISSYSGLTSVMDLTLEGTYLTGGSLRLDFTWTRGSSSLTQSLIDPTPATGQHFGLFARKTGSTYVPLTVEADFDTFSITSVPEPPALTLAMLGLSGLFAWGWRRPAA